MADHSTHSRDGKIASATALPLTGYLVFKYLGSIQLAFLMGCVASAGIYIGSQVPDTDIQSSIPYRYAVQVVSLAGAGGIVYLVATNWAAYLSTARPLVAPTLPATVPIEVVALIPVSGSLLLTRLLTPKLIQTVTGSHRTRTHNPVYLALAAIVLGGLLWTALPPLQAIPLTRLHVAVGLPTAIYLGTLVHIARDKVS